MMGLAPPARHRSNELRRGETHRLFGGTLSPFLAPRSACAALLLLAGGSGNVLASTAPGSTPPTFSTRVDVTAVRLAFRAVGRTGRPVPDLQPTEVSVAEDGKPTRVLELSRVTFGSRDSSAPVPQNGGTGASHSNTVGGTGWEKVAVWVVPDLLQRGNLQRSVARLRESASKLTQLAPVTVVCADTTPRVVARDVTSAGELRAALSDPAFSKPRWNRVLRLREEFLREDSLDFPAFAQRFAVAAASDERTVIESALGELAAWADDHAPHNGAGLLVLAVDGFDLDPADFYLQVIEALHLKKHPSAYRTVEEALRPFGIREPVENVTMALGRAGWVVVGLDTGTAWTTDRRWGQGSSGVWCAGRIDSRLVRHPQESMLFVTERTGGGVVPVGEAVPDALARFDGVYSLVYQAARAADEGVHHVVVTTSRAGVRIVGPNAVTQAPAGSSAVVKAVRALKSATEACGLNVSARVVGTRQVGGRFNAWLKVDTDLSGVAEKLAATGTAVFPITVAVELYKGEPYIQQEEHTVTSALHEGRWALDSPITWSSDAHRIAVMIEEITTGSFGTAIVELPRS